MIISSRQLDLMKLFNRCENAVQMNVEHLKKRQQVSHLCELVANHFNEYLAEMNT